MENCPNWLNYFVKLVRPGSLALMVLLLVFGGFFFGAVELFNEGAGDRAMRVFVGFFAAMDDNYYDTIKVMFTVYVIGRSGQAIASDYAAAKKAS